MRHGSGHGPCDRMEQRGFTFVVVLVLMALVMLGLSIAGPLWSQQARREREQELLRIGALYAEAIASYRQSQTGSLTLNPPKLEELLLDTRFIAVRRHLRKLYPDPVNPGQGWGLVLDERGRIAGVRSMSDEAPLAEHTIDLGVTVLARAQRYSDWKFVPKERS